MPPIISCDSLLLLRTFSSQPNKINEISVCRELHLFDFVLLLVAVVCGEGRVLVAVVREVEGGAVAVGRVQHGHL